MIPVGALAELSATQAPTIDHTTAQAVQSFSDGDGTVRAAAFLKTRNPDAVADPDVRSALLALLDRENRLVESTLRESNERVGVSEKYGEAFGEYLSFDDRGGAGTLDRA